MKNFVVAAIGCALGLAALTVGTDAAGAAPTGPSTVDETVRTLEASGYNVILNRTGAAPLADCTVSEVRPGHTHSTTDSRGGSSLTTTVTSDTVYVDVTC
ncbi:hypothetical protein [Micromonospora sp. WMMD736]|uniref:hypothetical protein n=1 Tax=Micromonospora sp. WMMD736 TaxID=3404112 RepID=UPI003B95593F